MSDVYFHGGRQRAREVAYRLNALLSGQASDTHGVSSAVFNAMGFAALSDIKTAFVDKARGNPGEDEIRWEPLKTATVANRRIGRRDTRNDENIRERERIRKREERRAFNRLSVSLPPDQARARARQIAGQITTRETGSTKAETLGGRSVEILRDTGVLLNSLSPGQIDGDAGVYTKPSGDGGDDQIFSLIENGVVIGTNVPYANTHHYGDSRRGIPARPFWPEVMPKVWLDRWITAGERALNVAARILFEAESQ